MGVQEAVVSIVFPTQNTGNVQPQVPGLALYFDHEAWQYKNCGNKEIAIPLGATSTFGLSLCVHVELGLFLSHLSPEPHFLLVLL